MSSFAALTRGGKNGRGDRIRTYDLLVPNQALYQAKLHPETSRRARMIADTVNIIRPHFLLWECE